MRKRKHKLQKVVDIEPTVGINFLGMDFSLGVTYVLDCGHSRTQWFRKNRVDMDTGHNMPADFMKCRECDS